MSAPGQVGGGWGRAGTPMALLLYGASLEACPREVCPHSWAVAQELDIFLGCHGMLLIPLGHSLSLFSSSRGPLRLKPFKFNYPQGFFSHR